MKRFTLVEGLWENSQNKQNKQNNQLWRYLACLLLAFTLGVGNVWGTETFTMSSIFDGSNQSASVTSPVNATVSTTASKSNADDGKLSNDDEYFQIILTDNTFTAVSFNGYINSTSTDKNWGFQFTTNGGSTWGSEMTQANDGTKSAHDIAVGVTIPSGANGIRIIRKAGTSTYVYSVTFTLADSGGGSSPSTSADDPGATGEITFESWTSLTRGQNYWKNGIKFWPYADLTSINNGSFTTAVPVHGYNENITAGSGWGSYTMSGLTTYAHFAMGISVTSPSVVEVIVDNNQNNDLTLANLFIKKDDVSYGDKYKSTNYTTGTDIKSRATITRVTENTGRYKISIPVSASDLATTSPYIIKLSAATWSDPCAFVFESVTVKPVYTVTYNANGKDGGGAAPTDGSSPYVSGSNVTVLGNTNSMTKTDCVFNGWNTRSDGTGTHYDVGAVISSISENITLYAEWVGYATSWNWWESGQKNDGTTFTYLTNKNYLCSFKSSGDKAVASWDISGDEVYRGVKIKTKDHSMAFWVPSGKRVSITFGYMSTRPTFTVGGVNKAGDLTPSTKDSATVTYTTAADTKFYIENETTTGTAFTIKSIKIEDSASDTYYLCSDFSGEWTETQEITPGSYVDVSLPEASYLKYKIKKVPSAGDATWYGRDGSADMERANCSNWTLSSSGPDCYVRTDIAGTYRFAMSLNGSGVPVMTVTYPTGVAVTLNMNGGGDPDTWQAYTDGVIPVPPYSPGGRDGYAFDGWYEDAEGSEPWHWGTTVNSATTLYAKWSHAWYFRGSADWSAYHLMSRSTLGSYWYYACSKGTSHNEFLVHCNGSNYGNVYNSPEYMCTNISDMNSSGNNWGHGDNSAIYEEGSDYYVLVFPPHTAANTTDAPKICAHKSLPEEFYAVESGINIYFDNSEAEWSNIYFRKGRSCHNEASSMTKVTGTDNLYKLTVAADYNGYQAFHIANNSSWTGSNSIYTVNTGDSYKITKATEFQRYQLDEDMTFTPGDEGDLDGTCQYYVGHRTYGMKKDNVSITAPTNGTITVAYTSGEGGSITSGNVDLAHTSILTISASASTGYALSSLTVNETAHKSGENYILSEDAVVAATFTPQVYSINYRDQGDVAFSGTHEKNQPTEHTYDSETTLKLAFKDGYMFGGWYTSSDCSTGLVTTIGATDKTADFKLYAKWTAMNLTPLANGTLYTASDMVPDGVEIGDDRQYYPGVSGNNIFNILGTGNEHGATGPLGSATCSDPKIPGSTFDKSLYFRNSLSISGTTLPTSNAIQFKVSQVGLLDIYCANPVELYLIKDGESAVQLDASETNKVKITKAVSYGTYYIYAVNTNSKEDDLRLYGLKFTPQYTVTLDGNGGTGNTSSVTVTYNSATIASITNPTKDGYIFGGWCSEEGGTGSLVIDANGDLQENVTGYTGAGGIWTKTAATTLYAYWISNAVYDPDMSTEAKLTATLAAKFDGSNRWKNIGEGIGVPNEDVDDYLTGDNYGLMFPKASVSVTYDLGKETTLYKITLDIVAEKSNEYDCDTYVEFLNEEGDHVDDWNPTMAKSDDPWDKQELTKEYPLGLNNVRYIEVSAMGTDTYMGLTRFKLEYAPTKTWVVLDNQSATSAGTTSVTATYGATTNLTSSITVPIKAGYVFGGYYTEEAGAGTQLIDANGAWLASKTGYTDGSKNWQFANPDLTLYAKWTQVYASGSYSFDGNLTVGSSPSKTVTTDATDYSAFRVDKIFFSDTKIQFEGTDGAPQGDGNDYNGWKVKANTTIKFFVENNSDVVVSIGSIGDGGSCSISYTNQSNVAQNDIAISAGTYPTYKVKAGTMVTISMSPGSKKSVTLKRIAISDTPACTNVAAVSSLSCSSQTGTTLTFTWTKAANASGYTATLYSNSGCSSEVKHTDINSGNTETVTFTSLSPNTTYYCKVLSHGNGTTYCEDGGETSAQSGTTLAQYDVTITVNPSGYGSVTESSLADVDAGTEISTSSNSLTIGETTITASPAATTAEYTYSFSNWTKGDGTALPASVTSDLSVRANFSRTANNYTLTWDFGGGSTSDDDYTTGSVAYGTTLDYPASNTMSKSGYDFAGWSTDASTMPAEALTITAQWAERFTVTYNAMTGSVDPTSATGSTANKVSLPEPTKDGYDFDGWYNTAGEKIGEAGDEYGPTAAITLYAKWKGSCAGGGGTSVRFLATNKNDAGVDFADMSTSSNTTQIVGDGTAKLIAISDAKLNDAGNKIGYRDDGRLNVVFKFSEATTLDIYFNANATSKTFKLSSFSSNKALKDIATSDYSSRTAVTSGITVAGAAFASSGKSTTSGAGSASSGVITLTTAGGIKVTYSSLAAGCYVFEADGSGNEGYLYGYDLNGGGSPCYIVTYDGNGADGGYTNDPTQYTSGQSPEILDCGYTKTSYAFIGWADGTDHRDAGTVDYQPGDHITSISDDVTLYAIWKQIKYFIGAASTTSWNTDGNWSPSGVPAITDPVVIQEDVTVDTDEAQALSVDIESGNTLTINAGQALIIEKTLTKAGGATAATDVIINSTRGAGTGALIIGGETGTNAATVNFESKVNCKSGDVNQYIGSPFSDEIPYVDYAIQMYKFAPTGTGSHGWWNKISYGDRMDPFMGYNLLTNDKSIDFLDLNGRTGHLNASSNMEMTIANGKMYYNSSWPENMFANGWLAPIHIDQFVDDDFVNVKKVIYIFNAGTPEQYEAVYGEGANSLGAESGNEANEAPGTYTVIPVKSASELAELGAVTTVIPSMQAFSVLATNSSPELKLNFKRLVYDPAKTAVDGGTSIGIEPTRAPRRMASDEDRPDAMRIRVRGENGWTANAYVLGREDFTDGYDDGWDGEYMEGDWSAPQLYSPTGDGSMVVNCVPEIEGTVIAFHAGSVDNNYTFSFVYNGENTWYLNDLREQKSVRIDAAQTYSFASASGDVAARFIISKTPIAMTPTGTGDIGDSQTEHARKVIIDDHVYIIRNGKMYNATGSLVK